MYKIFLFFILLLFPCIVFAHGGRTDSSGCHTNHKTGDYHCHGAPDNPGRSSYSNKTNSTSNYTNYNYQQTYNTPNTTTTIYSPPKNTTTHSISTTNYSNISSSSRNISKKDDDDGIGWFWILLIGGIIGWIFYNPKQ